MRGLFRRIVLGGVVAVAPVAEAADPGLVEARWTDGETTWTTSGFADIEAGRSAATNDLFWIASNTKGVAAALVLTFVDAGKIGLDDPVARYFPEWSGICVVKDGLRQPASVPPTVRMLLSHQAGLDFFPGMPIDRYSVRELVTEAVRRGLVHEPGSRWKYSNWGIDVAVAIAEKVGGKPWETLLKERILDPLGMRDTCFWPTDEQLRRLEVPYFLGKDGRSAPVRIGTVNQFRRPYGDRTRRAEAGGGLFSTVPDMLAFAQMVARKGVGVNGRRILSESICEEWYRAQTRPDELGLRPGRRYSFGMDVDPEKGTICHGGAYGTHIAVNWKTRSCRVTFVQRAKNGPKDGRLPDVRPAESAAVATRWQVTADGKPLALRHIDIGEGHPEPLERRQAMGEWYEYGTCLVKGPTRFVISCDREVGALTVLPEKFGIRQERTGPRQFAFTAERPFRLTFEAEGRRGALHLFGEEPQTLPADGPGVRRFPRGEHRAGEILLGNGETLVLEEGAVVRGAIRVVGTNVTVCGSGILTGTDYARFKGPRGALGLFGIRDSAQVKVTGITIERSPGWTFVIDHSHQVSVDGVKVLGSHMINDDGIDIVSSSDVSVCRTFVRTQDDCVALKGMSARDPMPPVEDVTVRDCTFWCDAANVFRIGFESNAAAMRRVRVEDVDVLRATPFWRPTADKWTHAVILLQPSNGMPMRDLAFRDIRIRADDARTFAFQALPRICHTWRPKTTYVTKGFVDSVCLERISVDGEPLTSASCRLHVDRDRVSGVTLDGVLISEK